MAMDASYEDKMYQQIEKSLSNNINDKLFVPIEMINEETYKDRGKKQVVDSVSYEENTMTQELIYRGNHTATDLTQDEGYRLSRAEYIRQAREACLRQMNTLDSSAGINDSYGGEEESVYNSFNKKKRDKVSRLFYEGDEEENLPEEIASFKSLTIRTVCAAVIFLSIFIIDKLKVDWGAFSYETIRQYVTGNNQLKVLEEILVSWLK